MINTAIVVTDVQISVKANRYSNEGFYFCAMGSAYPKVKFDTILFTCPLSTEVLKKWANGFIKNGLKTDGNFIGITLPIEEASKDELEDLPKSSNASLEEVEAILAETEAKTEAKTEAVIDNEIAETEHSFYKTEPKTTKKTYKKKPYKKKW